MAKEKSPVPAGAFVRVGVDNLDEGKFKKDLNAKLRKAYRDLREYLLETGDSGGKAMITAKIGIIKTKGASDHFSLIHNVSVSVPSAKNVSIVKARGDELLCQPIGASEADPDQQAFFDANGRVIGSNQPDQSSDVAGKIGPAVANA